MTISSQTAEARHPSAPWVRLAALCAVLVLLVGSLLQAAHVHKLPLADHTSSVTLLSEAGSLGEDAACPLCLIGSSALPAPSNGVLITLLAFHAHRPAVRSRLVPTDLPFAGFVRPPPASA